MKKLLLGAILLFSVMSCTQGESNSSETKALVNNEVPEFSNDMADVKPNVQKSFILKGDFFIKEHSGEHILYEYLDGTFEVISDEYTDVGRMNGLEGDVVLMLVSVDEFGKASIGSFSYNLKTNPDTGIYPFTPMNFTGNGYSGQERTGVITGLGDDFVTITYVNKYEYYSYITHDNKTGTKIDERTFSIIKK